jgi:hypothetical protein
MLNCFFFGFSHRPFGAKIILQRIFVTVVFNLPLAVLQLLGGVDQKGIGIEQRVDSLVVSAPICAKGRLQPRIQARHLAFENTIDELNGRSSWGRAAVWCRQMRWCVGYSLLTTCSSHSKAGPATDFARCWKLSKYSCSWNQR